MQSVWKTISFWGKKKVRNNFHNKGKLDFDFREKKRLPLPLLDSSAFEHPFADRDDQNLLQD